MPKFDPLTSKKICGHCREVKTVNDFGSHKGISDNLKNSCRDCENAAAQLRRDNPDQRAIMLARTDSWRSRNPEHVMLNSCKWRAEIKSLPCTITKADIHIPDTCPICGITLARGGGRKNRNFSPSLDMYDPTLGYIPGNIWVICDRCNGRKQDMSGEDHVEFGWQLINAFKKAGEV